MKNVMIVDDNHISVEGILKNIRWNGLHARVAACEYDGISAKKRINEQKIDLIITDIEMPGMSGLELAEFAIQTNAFVKIILISAYDEFEYAKKALRVGVYDFVEKPLDYRYLEEKIRNALEEIEREEKELELLEQSKPAMINSFFSRLLHTAYDEAKYSLSHYPDYLSLNLNCHLFCVIFLQIENKEEIREKLGLKKFHVALAALQEQILKQTANWNLSYVLGDFRGPICILGHNFANSFYFQKELYSVISTIEEFSKSSILRLVIGIGNIVKDIWELRLSYESAKKALEYRFFLPQQSIFDARDNKGSVHTNKLFNSGTDEFLIQLICKKDLVGIKRWLNSFSESMLAKYQTKNLLFLRIYTMLGNILRFLYEINIDCAEIEQEMFLKYSGQDSFRTKSEIVDWLYQICVTISAQIDSSTQTYHKQVCDSVIKYIKKNYADNALCLNDIANDVMISPTYLSALYKKSTAQTISDTITSIRIDVACRLLSTSQLTLREISEKVGYTNQYYFSSCFKKKMGITPSEYRRSM